MSAFTYSIKTMGCKANIYDSLVLERELTELGGERDDERPDVFVLNSCTVTAEADRQCGRELALVKKRSPKTWTIVAGCFAQVAPDRVEADPNADLAAGNSGKSRLKLAVAERFGLEGKAQAAAADPDIYWGQLPSMAGKTRAFLKIQEGCNDYCTYCIIPYARGKSRSVKMGEILAEANRLVASGIREIVLTGTNIADYGLELGTSLEDLVEALLERTSVPRLRLTSLDPSEITERLLKLMSPKADTARRLMPHLHVSLQSPVSRVLRAMKREYRREDVERALHRIHETDPGIYVGMDVIAGFPSETPEEHAEALATLRALPWTRLHVFPYSEREGTPATRIPGAAPNGERKRRARDLLALSRERHEVFAEGFVNKTLEGVLLESPHESEGVFYSIGHAPNYIRVMARLPARNLDEARAFQNTETKVQILSKSPKPAQDWTLEGLALIRP
jgi:threonylcarbamoyladenosine tRNA methylthiotransferase MtaB